jgi:antitoxin FitA-like protein
MPSILVQGLDPKTIPRLKERARLNGRSLHRGVKEILERAADMLTMDEARRLSERWRRRLGGRSLSDTTGTTGATRMTARGYWPGRSTIFPTWPFAAKSACASRTRESGYVRATTPLMPPDSMRRRRVGKTSAAGTVAPYIVMSLR